jgi:hypothetical protein
MASHYWAAGIPLRAVEHLGGDVNKIISATALILGVTSTAIRKLIFALVFTVGATSASLAGEAAMANAYEYLDTHGCPGAGFSRLNCSYHRSPPGHHQRAVKAAVR